VFSFSIHLPYVPFFLLVFPPAYSAAVMMNWQEQIKRHVKSDCMSVYTYHGSRRTKDEFELEKYDVVITTFNTLAMEWVNPKDEDQDRPISPLFSINWRRYGDFLPVPLCRPVVVLSLLLFFSVLVLVVLCMTPFFFSFFLSARVILDEAHAIRDRTTRQSRAACSLNAERRWAVTGTPFQNKLGDAYPLFNFLRLEPFVSFKFWDLLIIQPLKNKDPKGLERLQMILTATCLRRKKSDMFDGRPLLNLPEKSSRIRSVSSLLLC
jgi:SNF2 family DNA or RNA helicase